MKARLQATCFRLMACLLIVPGVVFSDDDHSSIDDGQRFVEVGQLAQVRSSDGKPRFVLLDQQGEVISNLRPVAGVDLAKHVGEEVGVTARMLVNSATPILLAESVTTFGAARQLVDDGIQREIALASHEESLVVGSADGASEELSSVLPTPRPLEGVVEYPLSDSHLAYSDGYPHVVGGHCGVPGCTSCGVGCGQVGCNSCLGLPGGAGGRYWLRGESLIWWTKGMDTPALLVASPAGTSQRNAGVAGVAGNTTLFGGDELFSDSRSGARFRLGRWCDRCNLVGLETDFFFLNDESAGYSDSSIGNQIIGRPFIDSAQGPSAQLVDFPGLVAGTAHIDAETSLWSINPRLRVNLACERFPAGTCRDPCAIGGYRLDLLVGYRYMRLADDLAIREQLMAPTAGANGQIPLIPRFDNVTFFDIRDSFSTTNEFHGADIGFTWEGYRGRWSLELLGKVGIGNSRQEVSIQGSTSRFENGNTFNSEGGVLALEPNIGTYSRDEFAIIPEFGATLGYSITPRTRFLVGYSFLYWSDVVRAGDQIDTTINQAFLPDVQPTTGPSRPEFSFVDSSFWAQGLSLGLDYRW